MKNNKIILTLILVLTIGIVGLTIAYFSNSSTITNTFNTNPYGTTVTEEFVSPQNWLPGTSTDKSLTVTNSGQVDEAVRISYTETWTSRSAKNNDEEGDLPLSQNGNTAALIHFTNTDDWTTVTENGTTYRYYNYKLAPSATTSELLDYVTFNPAITNSSNCVENITATGKTITCNSTGTGYDDATYKLVFNIETIQYDKYKTAWGTNVNIASMKPMNASQLALKSNPVSVTNYTDGNVHEMYTFNHAATEQTPALTDYRYIGNDPYNYVYFNCDSLDNQNEETCEVWRIIGVFDVERPDPNDNTQTITERRIKLVRGSAFSNQMYWDKDRDITIVGYNEGTINEWVGANLELFLNGDYLNRENSAESYGLKLSAQELINETMFYLGGRYWGSSQPYFGSAEDMYIWERGTEVYNQNNAQRSVNWSGKVGLIYPSDMFLVYAKNIENKCYNDPYDCKKNKYIFNPSNGQYEIGENYAKVQMGWIYNTNFLEGQLNLTDIWFLSPMSDNDRDVFYVENGGAIGRASIGNTWAVRPTLYLSSSVKIIDGDGSINNPYKLSNS